MTFPAELPRIDDSQRLNATASGPADDAGLTNSLCRDPSIHHRQKAAQRRELLEVIPCLAPVNQLACRKGTQLGLFCSGAHQSPRHNLSIWFVFEARPRRERDTAIDVAVRRSERNRNVMERPDPAIFRTEIEPNFRTTTLGGPPVSDDLASQEDARRSSGGMRGVVVALVVLLIIGATHVTSNTAPPPP